MQCTLLEWQKMEKPLKEIILQASAIPPDDKWRKWPIGMSWQFFQEKKNALRIGQHHKTLMMAVNPATDKGRRPDGNNRRKFVSTLEKSGYKNTTLSQQNYFKSLADYKFVMSPEGKYFDCHRHYEALMAGSIPIIEFNPLIELKYRGCPILYTTDYSEINETYLLERYNEMLHETWDFSRLFLSYYDEQAQIKACGNYHMRRMLKVSWY
jgi:hypothetical protein